MSSRQRAAISSMLGADLADIELGGHRPGQEEGARFQLVVERADEGAELAHRIGQLELLDEPRGMAGQDAVGAVGHVLQERGAGGPVGGETGQEGPADDGTRIVKEAQKSLFFRGRHRFGVHVENWKRLCRSVATPEEKNAPKRKLHSTRARRAHARAPKRAVPMRTRVLPSATASSRSPLIPIESSGKAGARGEAIPDLAQAGERAPRPVGSAGQGRDRHQALDAEALASQRGLKELRRLIGFDTRFRRVGPALTWSRTGRTRPSAAASRSSRPRSFALSTLWTRSKMRAATLALFDWRWPMSSQATGAAVRDRLSTAS